MLERYFVRPQTVDRIRAGWIGSEIEQYVVWLAEQGYSSRSVLHRVPLLIGFGEFARARGARSVEELPAHVEAFVSEWMVGRPVVRQGGRQTREGGSWSGRADAGAGDPGVCRPRSSRVVRDPFADALPGFFDYLASERGLRPGRSAPTSIISRALRRISPRIGVERLSELSPAILTAFVAERAAAGLGKATVRDGCGVLRVFLRYAHREGAIATDLSGVLDRAQFYRLSSIPRSITWEEVGAVLAGVDRRSPCGKRDWAILMLLVTYGLRGREVAALTLDDIDWKRERLAGAGAQGRALDRVPAVGVGRRSARRLPAATADLRRTADACSSGRSRRSSRSARPRCPPARGTTC